MYTILYPELEARVHAPRVRTRAAQPGLSEEADHMHNGEGARASCLVTSLARSLASWQYIAVVAMEAGIVALGVGK
jgi:hypothetical protein